MRGPNGIRLAGLTPGVLAGMGCLTEDTKGNQNCVCDVQYKITRVSYSIRTLTPWLASLATTSERDCRKEIMTPGPFYYQ